MTNIRRWYIFLVSAVSLQSVTWAIITLLRNLLVPGLGAGGGAVSFDASAVALQIAIIVIGLPVYLAHWLWAERLAVRDGQERGALLRRFYLLGMMAGFLAPAIANAFALLNTVLRHLSGIEGNRLAFPDLEPGSALIYHGVALVVLALLWFYHWRTAAAEAQTRPEAEEGSPTISRLYIYGFSAAGLTMTVMSITSLVGWLLFQIGTTTAIGTPGFSSLPGELARLFLGLPLWLLFWHQVQQQFAQAPREQASVLRKVYLYLVVFIGVLLVVTNVTGILAGLFRRLLDLPPEGDIRPPLAVMLGGAVLWAYHAAVLRRDAAIIAEQPRQATVRRIYLYLVASIGLAAFLSGLSGDISLLIRSLSGDAFIANLRQQLATFTATLFAGLPVWLIPWCQAQIAAADPTTGLQERSSQVRKAYLYFYLFVATMTILTSAVFIVFQLVSLALGARTALNLSVELGQAIAFSLIAVAVWLYHGILLRQDGRLEAAAEAQQQVAWRVAIVDGGDGRLGRFLLDRLQQELPQLTWQSIGLTAEAAAAMGTEVTTDPASLLNEVDLIVGPWTMIWAGAAGSQELAEALVQTQARKLLLPVQPKGWEWVGVEPWQQGDLIRQTVQSLRRIIRGQSLESGLRSNLAALVVAVIAGLILFGIALSAVADLFF